MSMQKRVSIAYHYYRPLDVNITISRDVGRGGISARYDNPSTASMRRLLRTLQAVYPGFHFEHNTHLYLAYPKED